MKILFFINSLHSGGKERRLLELIKGLAKKPEINISLVLLKQDIHYDVDLKNINLYFITRKGLTKNSTAVYKFYKITKKIKPDILNVWGNLPAIIAIPTKLILGIPMINNQIANAPNTISSSFQSYKTAFLFSDKIIANSIAGLISYKAPKKKSSVIYNGFDFDRIKNLEEKSKVLHRLQISTSFVIGMVASITDKKDYDTFIRAANLTLDLKNDITFLCIGPGNPEALKGLINPQNVDRIKFLGKQDKVESIMNICDIGVLLTNTEKHGEGISNALLEFMALGKPVVATNSGGTTELIEDQRNGFIINGNSAVSISEKFIKLISDKKLRENYGLFSRQIVENKFNISLMIDAFYEEFVEVV